MRQNESIKEKIKNPALAKLMRETAIRQCQKLLRASTLRSLILRKTLK